MNPLKPKLVAVAACGVLMLAGCSSWLPAPEPGRAAAPASPTPKGEPPVLASVEAAFAHRPVFGVTAMDSTEDGIAKLGRTVGCRPAMIQRFISVYDGVSINTLRKTAKGIPVISIEPWHTDEGAQQPDFTLKATIDGKWDQRYVNIAKAIVEYRDLVLVRFAHEMNGDWYPWGATNGNKPEEYGQAYRHVVELFKAMGASNVLWVWSPNIIRSTPSKTITQYWPGDEYVDVVGVTGYGVRESSPEITYRPTLDLVNALTTKPILLTEVGVQPDPDKRKWIAEFGPWLARQPQIAGFIWYEKVREGDWRFSDTTANLAAFKTTLAAAKVKC